MARFASVEEIIGSGTRTVSADDLREATPTYQDQLREEMAEMPFWEAVGLAGKLRTDEMTGMAKKYWADMTGDTALKQKVLNERHMQQFPKAAMVEQRPGASAVGTGLSEMQIPNPYGGTKLGLNLLSGAAQTAASTLLTPGKTKEDLAGDVATTGAVQLGVEGLTRGLMPGRAIPPWSKAEPQVKGKIRDLQREGYQVPYGTRVGRDKALVEDQLRDLGTTAAGLRAFDKTKQVNRAVSDKVAARAIGSTSKKPTEQVMSDSYARMKSEFQDLFSNRKFEADDALWDSLEGISTGAETGGRLSSIIKTHPDIREMADDVLEEIAEDMTFHGKDVQNFTRKIRKKADAARKAQDMERLEGLEGLEEVVMDWAERSSPDPEFSKRLQKVKREYANYKMLAAPKALDESGSVNVPKVAGDLARKGSELYARGEKFSPMDPIFHFNRMIPTPPKSSGLMQRGSIGNLIAGAAPGLSPRYWGTRLAHTGILPNASKDLPGTLSNLAGYMAARPGVSETAGSAGMGAAGLGLGVIDLLMPELQSGVEAALTLR